MTRRLTALFVLLLALLSAHAGWAVCGAPADGGTYAECVTADSPAGYWRVGESSGDFADSAGNGHTATTPETTVYGKTSLLTGDANTAFGSDSGGPAGCPFQVASHADFNVTDQLTVEFWYKMTSTGSFTIMARENGADYRWIFKSESNSPTFVMTIGAGFPACGGSARIPTVNINDGARHHLAAVYNGTDCRMYVDGVLKDTVAATGSINSQTGTDIVFGGQYSTGDCSPLGTGFTGDEPAVYLTALSAGRVLVHYQAGANVPAAVTATPTNTPVDTPTVTPTQTPTSTVNTPTITPTWTGTPPTATATFTATPTFSTPTWTPANTPISSGYSTWQQRLNTKSARVRCNVATETCSDATTIIDSACVADPTDSTCATQQVCLLHLSLSMAGISDLTILAAATEVRGPYYFGCAGKQSEDFGLSPFCLPANTPLRLKASSQTSYGGGIEYFYR